MAALRPVVDPSASSTATSDSASHPKGWVGNVPATTNKSCDYCSRRKRRCDGDGLRPCSRCKKVGAGHQCIYSKRRPHKPRRTRPEEAVAYAAAVEHPGAAHTEISLERSGGEVMEALLRRRMHSFKRYRLSASPATGLVGMKENALLSDYFGCVGFLPLTSQSEIRETMVRIMVAPTTQPQQQQQRAGFEYVNFGEGNRDAVVAGCGGGVQAVWSGDGEGEAPSSVDAAASCIFWSAIAVGGLVQGAPVESVTRYLELARSASKGLSGPPTTKWAKAWTLLGYLYGFLADLDMFHACLLRADSFIRDSTSQDSINELPVGLVETVKHSETVRLFTGDMVQSEMESFCREEHPLPQISETATEAEIYQFVMQSYRGFEQAFYGDVCAEYHARVADASEEEEAGGLEEISVDNGASSIKSSFGVVSLSGERAVDPSNIMATMMTRLKDHSCEFERLESAVDRPHLRAGVGGLIINGTLVFSKAVKQDVKGVAERMDRCVEVLERYPGLCRYAMGSHIAHILTTVLASMDAPGTRQLYDKLRAVYNPMRPASSGAIPPFEEWQGVAGICDHVYCRSLEKLTDSDEMMFSSRPPNHRHSDSQADSEYIGDAEDRFSDADDNIGVSLAAHVGLSGEMSGVVQYPCNDTAHGAQGLEMMSHHPPGGKAGEDTTNSVVTLQDDFNFTNSSGTEELFADRPADAAAETGKGLAQRPVESDAVSTISFGSHKAVDIDSNSESDIDIEGDGVEGKHDAGNTAAGGVTDTTHISSWAGLDDPGPVDVDVDKGFSAADWLAVTHAMLDQTSSGPGVE